MSVTRRRTLLAASTVVNAALVGCLDDDVASSSGDGAEVDDEDDGRNASDDDSTDGDGDGGNGTDEADGNGGNGTDEADGYVLADHDERAVSASTGSYRAEVLNSADATEDVIDDERAADVLESVAAETDFDRSALLLLQARGRNLCDALELESVDVVEAGVTVDARVVDESAPDEVCAQQLHYPTVLVRVVFEDEVPRRWDVTITDDDGTDREFDLDASGDPETG